MDSKGIMRGLLPSSTKSRTVQHDRGETQEKASKVPGCQNLPVLGSLRAPQVCLGAQPHHACWTTGTALERGADCRPLNGRAGEPRAMSFQEGWSRRGPPEHPYQRPVLPRAGGHCSGAGRQQDRSCTPSLPKPRLGRSFRLYGPLLSNRSTLALTTVKTSRRNPCFPFFFRFPVMVWPFKIVLSICGPKA